MRRTSLAASALLFLLGLTPASAQALNRGRSAASRPVKTVKGLTHKGPRRRAVYERPVPTYTHSGMPNIQAQAAVVLDMKEGGPPLFQKNPDAVRPIASISKLMAMMVVLDRRLDLEAMTTISEDDRRLALRGARSRLPVGMTFKNRDLLHAALMASDNRAVPALGRAVGLNPEQMTSAMNARARELGLKITNFGDPTGLDHRNVSTPNEVALMLKTALRYPLISEICQTAHYVARPTNQPRLQIEYTNTDVLVRGARHRVLGGKTGYNDLAGYCLAVAARLVDKSGKSRDVAMVFLGAQGKMTRFADFSRAAQWLSERGPAPVQTGSLTPRATPRTL